MLPRLSVHAGRKLLNTTGCFQRVTACKFSCVARNLINGTVGREHVFSIHKHSKVHGVYLVRFESTVDTIIDKTVPNASSGKSIQETQNVESINKVAAENDLISEIPEPPVPFVTEEIIETVKLHANGEPTFSSIGLGGYGPFGLIEYYFEWLHISLDMPWWAAIVLTSLAIKILTFPLAINMQKNNAKMNRVLPEMVALQEKMSDARKCGNSEEAVLYAYELQEFLKKNNISVMPTSTFLRFGLHIPVFISLREMVNTPVASFKDGGLFWFKDLTVADPYYLLPLCTTITLYAVTEHAMQSASMKGNTSAVMRYVMRGLPVLSFLFSIHFPGAILCHWVTSNIVTLIQNEILKMRRVQEYFKIPPIIKHPETGPSSLKQKGFREAFNESWTNMKISNKLANHARADMIQFNEAGKGPLRRTFKYKPVQGPQKATMSAMKK